MSSIVAKAILRLEPNAEFNVIGNVDDYTIEWHSEDITQPSETEIANSIEIVKSLNYQINRSKEYPSIGDQLDDLFHAGAFSTEMAAKIQAIKDKYPKN